MVLGIAQRRIRPRERQGFFGKVWTTGHSSLQPFDRLARIGQLGSGTLRSLQSWLRLRPTQPLTVAVAPLEEFVPPFQVEQRQRRRVNSPIVALALEDHPEVHTPPLAIEPDELRRAPAVWIVPGDKTITEARKDTPADCSQFSSRCTRVVRDDKFS